MQRKLEGRSLEIGVKLDAEHEAISKFQQELQEEGMRKWQAFKSASKDRVDKLIAELGALENLDMDKYMIDGTYYEEHGLMFIVDNNEDDEQDHGGLERVIAAAMAAGKVQ